MSRGRDAPIDRRTAISFWRAVARDSSRLATFAQTMSSTRLVTIASAIAERVVLVSRSYVPRAPESTSRCGTAVRFWLRASIRCSGVIDA